MMEAVIFDFNGTLFYDTDKHMIAWKRYLETFHNYTPTEWDFKNILIGSTNTHILKSLVDENITPEEVVAAVECKENFYFEACLDDPDSLYLTHGAAELFDLLTERHIPFMIATGSARQNMDFYFKHLPLGKWFSFDNVIYDDYSRRGKPFPDIYLDSAKLLGVSIDKCVVFEDSLPGYRSALEAGVGAMIMVEKREDFDKFLKLEGVTTVVEDLRDPEGLLRMAGLTN